MKFAWLPQLLAQDFPDIQPGLVIAGVVILLVGLTIVMIVINYGKLWFQAYMSERPGQHLSLIGMTCGRSTRDEIVQAKIMALQAGIGTDPTAGITTRRLEAHYLAGGRVQNVDQRDHRRPSGRHRFGLRPGRGHRPGRPRRVGSRADQRLSQGDRLPRSDDCRRNRRSSAIAKNGVELKIRARVTVRTNLAAVDRRRDRRDDHRPRGRGDHHLDRFVGKPS